VAPRALSSGFASSVDRLLVHVQQYLPMPNLGTMLEYNQEEQRSDASRHGSYTHHLAVGCQPSPTSTSEFVGDILVIIIYGFFLHQVNQMQIVPS
jgi:hypothetical protein